MHQETLVILKNLAINKKCIGKIISRIEDKGYAIVEMRMGIPDRKIVEEHYAEHRTRNFFKTMVDYISRSSIVWMVVSGHGAISGMRTMIGSTDPMQSAPGTIRFDYGLTVEDNIIHGSDSVDSARREIKIWFPDYCTIKDDV